MSKWFEKTIGEAPIFIGDGNYSSKYPKSSDFVPMGVPFITASDMINGHIRSDNFRYISKRQHEELRKGHLCKGDVIVVTRGNGIGNVAFVEQEFHDANINAQLVLLRADEKVLHNRFLYFLLSSKEFKEILIRFGSGSAQPQIPINSLVKIPVRYPDYTEQRFIAHILGTLDDKIELNRRVNETLEEMARALFKSWFVDFDPVRAKAEGRAPRLPKPLADLFPDSFEDSDLGEIPKGWQVVSIGEIADVVDCLHSKKPERQESGMPLLQLWNIRDDGLLAMENTYFIDEVDYRRWVSRMEASPGDCVITNVGRVGAVAQIPVGQKAALGRNMTGIRCKPSFPFPTVLLECLISKGMKDEISFKMDTGTILDALNVRSIPSLRFIRPTREILKTFERTVRPLRAQMEVRLLQSRTLAALRDTLLPKLTSGELRVKDAERFLGGHV